MNLVHVVNHGTCKDTNSPDGPQPGEEVHTITSFSRDGQSYNSMRIVSGASWFYIDSADRRANGYIRRVADVGVPRQLAIGQAGGRGDEQRKNGRLMAAAPEMQAALRLCLTEIEQFHSTAYPGCTGGCPAHEAMNAAKAALRKAEQGA